MKYRAEIDGLRALAVVPVILFHAGFELFSGGFVGVDVFFVISGYLITTILINDIENNRFSIVYFYERRARRILPALFFVTILCVPFALMWMVPHQLKSFSQSLVAVSLFSSNILFWQESGYFDTVAEEKPLLHTWSLAVEEQYYLLFPIFLILTWRFGKTRVFQMIVLMAALSLLLSEWGWRNKATANFYLAPTRVWELFAGSIAAFIVQKKGVQKSNRLTLLGLIAIVFSIFAYDQATPFPSVYALVPVLGTVLVVLYANHETIAAKLLSNKLLVGIGLISYSAYLWHQPLFAFSKIRYQENLSELLMVVLSISSILFAYLSWKFIEIPFRDDIKIGRKKIFIFSVFVLAIFISLGLSGHLTNGFESRVSESKVLQGIPNIDSSYCHNEGRRSENQLLGGDFCVVGEGSLEFAVIGDSHAGAIFEAAGEFFTDMGKSSLAVSGGYCAPLLNGFYTLGDCTKTTRAAFERALSSETIHTIIIVAEWANYTSGYRGNDKPKLWSDSFGSGDKQRDNLEIFARSYAATIEAVKSTKKQLIVLLPVPEFTQNAYDSIERSLLLNESKTLISAVEKLPSISLTEYEKRNLDVLNVFDRHKVSNIKYLETKGLFCDSLNCYQFDKNSQTLYSDFNHVNYYGAKKIVNALAPLLK